MIHLIWKNQDLENSQLQVRSLAWQIAGATLILLIIGCATRVFNAGLACPDWPLCYGQLVPARQMNLQVFLEWFHRLDASLIGCSMIALVGFSWWQRRNLPVWLLWAVNLALGLVVIQGILGGLTVTELLRFDIVTAHLGVALLFFSTLLAIAAALTPLAEPKAVPGLWGWGAVAVVIVYGQNLLGGLVASQWAVSQCLGGYDQLCRVMWSHLLGVVPATTATLAVVIKGSLNKGLPPQLEFWLRAIALALLTQILLGTATFRLRLDVIPLTIAHHTTGAVLLGSLVIFTCLAWRTRNFPITTK